MANYKTKQKDLKNISGKTDTGGAPLFANDFVRLQQNSKADAINFQEGLRRRLGNMSYYRGPVLSAEAMHSFGVILAGCTYNNSTSGSVTLSEGYILSEGEICYFPGATYSVSSAILAVFYLRKGTLLTESRVFADGVNKEFLVEYQVSVFQTQWSGNSPSPEPLTTADLTKEYVVITAGAAQNSINANFAEKHCTIDAALAVTKIGEENNYLAFQDATLATGWALAATNIGLRELGGKVNHDGSFFISGSVTRTFSGGNTPVDVCTLSNHNNDTNHVFFFPVTGRSQDAKVYNFVCSIDGNGLVKVFTIDAANWPTALTVTLYFNNTLCLSVNNCYNKSFAYNNKFLDVTP